MHGYWTAIARHASVSHWFSPNWWPYWDAGMPFEWTYAPLVPALSALWARIAGVDPAFGFGSVSGLFYCLTPVTLFACAAVLASFLRHGRASDRAPAPLPAEPVETTPAP